MGIREKRLYRAINRILKEELQKGNLPSSKEFAYRLSSYLSRNDLSRPEFSFRPVRKGSVARASDLNETVEKIYRDFHILYENTVDLHNIINKSLSKFEVDKSKLEYEINILEAKLKEMILLYGKSGFLNSVYDTFDDLTKVNLGKSTAHVDIKKHEVAIPEEKNTTFRITPKAVATFVILPEIARQVEVIPISGSPSDALNDHMNEVWQELVLSKNRQQIAGYFFIEFEKKEVLNRIVLSPLGPKPVFVRVEFSPDNLNWFALPYHEQGRTISDEYAFDFPSIEIRQIRILLSKTEPDDQVVENSFFTNVESKGDYKYLFGMKNIQFFQLDAGDYAVLESKPLKVDVPANQNFTINKVSLLVDEVLPNGTDIRYSIALAPAEGKEPEWHYISPVNREAPKYDQIIDFKNIVKMPAMQFRVDPNISIGEYELEHLYANGIRFYKIGEIEKKKIIGGSERLYVGRNTWGVRSYPLKHNDHDIHIPSLKDWEGPIDFLAHDYVPIEDGRPGMLLNQKQHTEAMNYMFTLGLFSEKSEELISAVPVSTEPIAIFVNGEKLFEGVPDTNSRINYLLKNGWNDIVVLVYIRNVEAANGSTVDLGFDPRKYGSYIYSKAQPMEKVSLFDLRYNVKSNDRNKYAIMETNDKSAIVLNHIVPGLEYDFYFSYVDGEAKDTILFRAEFIKDRAMTNLSPKLKQYQLRFS